MILGLLIGLALGFAGIVTLSLFASRAYDRGWADCKAHTQLVIDRLASAHRDNIARVIGTMAPCPESPELEAERARRGGA